MHKIRLTYQPPHDFPALLGFFAKRAIPGVERVDEESYRRVFTLAGQVGELTVTQAARGHALDLQIDFADASTYRFTLSGYVLQFGVFDPVTHPL